MTRKNKSKKSQQKKQTPGKPRVRSRVKRPPLTALTHAVCAITDPFCPGANQGRWPDNSNTKSIAWNISGQAIFLDTLANGGCAALFVPGRGVSYSVATAIAGANTVGTFPDALTAVNAASLPSMSRFRITSWGLKISCPLSRYTCKGTLAIRCFSPESLSGLTSVELMTSFADCMVDIPMQRIIDTDEYVVSMPLGTDARLFRASSEAPTLLSTGLNLGWQVVTVAGLGMPESTAGALSIYVYAHVEYTPSDGDANYSFATPPPRSNLLLQESSASTLDKVGNFVSGAASKVEALFQSKAARTLAALGAGYATGGVAGAVGSLMLTNSAHAHIPEVD